MKVLVVGASGLLGQAVAAALRARHELVEASRARAPHRVDLADVTGLSRVFDAQGPFDAVVRTAGEAGFGNLGSVTAETIAAGLNIKLVGQIRLSLIARARLREGGSITLTTGVLSRDPIRSAAATAMPRGLRINAVSPTVLSESWNAYGRSFAGFEPVPAARVALAYLRSVEGAQTGQTYAVH